MYVERHEVNVTTDASGNATAYTPTVSGRVFNVIYVKDGTDPFADGVDVDVTGDLSTLVIWDEDNVNASKTLCPRQPTHDKAGTASLYAVAGESVEDYIVVAQERIKIVVAQGGNTKKGKFIVIVG